MPSSTASRRRRCSDSAGVAGGLPLRTAKPHPSTYGTYPGRGPYIPPQLILRYYHISGELGFLSTCEHKVFDEGYAAFNNSVDPVERERLLRESGQLKFDNYCEVPIAWLPGSIVIDPKVVKTFIYPGNINATFSHIEEVVPAD